MASNDTQTGLTDMEVLKSKYTNFLWKDFENIWKYRKNAFKVISAEEKDMLPPLSSFLPFSANILKPRPTRRNK